MGILNNPLGINLTDEMPLISSPFTEGYSQGFNPTPPGSDFIITETGEFILTETTLNFLITE